MIGEDFVIREGHAIVERESASWIVGTTLHNRLAALQFVPSRFFVVGYVFQIASRPIPPIAVEMQNLVLRPFATDHTIVTRRLTEEFHCENVALRKPKPAVSVVNPQGHVRFWAAIADYIPVLVANPTIIGVLVIPCPRYPRKRGPNLWPSCHYLSFYSDSI